MTEDLLNELLDSPDPAAFASKHKLACRSLPDYLQQLLDERGLRRPEVVRQAGINPTFGYQIFGMNPQGDMARLPAVACAISYVCVWLVMGCPIPLLVDTRPIEKLFPLLERPSLKQRVIAVAGMAGVAFAVLTLIGILFLRES